MLAFFRDRTIDMLRILDKDGILEHVRSVCITFLFRPCGHQNLCRLYRINMLSDAIITKIRGEKSETFFVSNSSCIQCSDVDSITALLDMET
jgi:hypothetical protein